MTEGSDVSESEIQLARELAPNFEADVLYHGRPVLLSIDVPDTIPVIETGVDRR